MVVSGCGEYTIGNDSTRGCNVPSSTNEAYTMPSYAMVARSIGQRHAKKHASEMRWSPSRPSNRHRQKTPEKAKSPGPKAGVQSTPSLPSPSSPSKQWFQHLQHKAHDVTSTLEALMVDLTREDWKNRPAKMAVQPLEPMHLARPSALPKLQNPRASARRLSTTYLDSALSSKQWTDCTKHLLLETPEGRIGVGARVLVDLQRANLSAGIILNRAPHPAHVWVYSIDLLTGETETNIPHGCIFVERHEHRRLSQRGSVGGRSSTHEIHKRHPRPSILQKIATANFMDVWQAELLKKPGSPKTRVRCALLQKCGSVSEMMKSLDSNNNGNISMCEFVQNMTSLGFDPMKISGKCCRTFQEIFHEFDMSKDGIINISELFGIDERYLQSISWEMMTTMQQWNQWCRNTTTIETNRPLCAKWNCSESKLRNMSARQKHEIQAQTSREKMQQWFRLGERRPKIVAQFLRSGLDLEMLAMETKRSLADRTNSIQRAIQSFSDSNKVLMSARENFMDVMEKNLQRNHRAREPEQEAKRKKEQEQKEGAARATIKKFDISSIFRTGQPTGDELVYFFSEIHLDPVDIETRKVAREMTIPLQVVEVMREAFSLFNKDESGVLAEDEFKSLVPLLQGNIDLTKNCLNAQWRSADLNNTGGVDFEEFIKWYCRDFGIPNSASAFGQWCTKKRKWQVMDDSQ